MKKILKVSALSIIFMVLFTLTVFAAQTGKVNVDAIRIRKEANTTSDILEVVDKDEKVTIIEEKGEWVKVKYGTKEGYCMKKYLTISGTKDEKKTTTTTEEPKTTKTVLEEGSLEKVTVNSSLELPVEVKLRVLPNFMSSAIDTFQAGTQVKVINKMGNWLQVTNDVKTGWINGTRAVVIVKEVEEEKPEEEVKEEPVKEETKKEETKKEETKTEETTSTTSEYKKTEGRINVTTARVREKPSTTSEIVGTLDYNDKVTIDNETGEWYHLKSGNVTGYVRKDLVTTGVSSRGLEERREETKPVESTAAAPAAQETPAPAASANGASVVSFAKNYLGYPYVAAGKNPTTGFDCSGFTQYVFSNFGVALGGSAASQTSAGTEVSRDQLAPGDLVLFLDEGKSMVGHAGIYIGGNQFIHAANPKRGVVIDFMNESNAYYNSRYVTARRVVN